MPFKGALRHSRISYCSLFICIYLILVSLEICHFNRIEELEEKKRNIEQSTQTAEPETKETKEDSPKEDKVFVTQ